MNISRRFTLLLPMAIPLAGCGTTSVTPVTIATGTSQLATDAGLLVAGLQAVIADVGTTASSSVLATLNADLAATQNFATAVAAAANPPAATTVQEIVQILEGAAPVLLGLIPGAASISGIVQAILSLTPILLSDVGEVTLATGSAMRMETRAAAKRLPLVSTVQARLILRGVTAH